jgi:hypothetical protein
MDGLLDERRLDGVISAERRLRATRAVRSIDCYDHAVAIVGTLCQQMGGIADLLIPADTSDSTHPWYLRVIDTSELDIAVGETAHRLASELPGHDARRPPSMLEISSLDDDHRRPITVCLPHTSDPWHLSYLCALGDLPESPDAEALEYFALRDNLQFEDFIDVQRESPTAAGVEDLVRRFKTTTTIPALYMSLFRLTRHPAKVNSSNALDGWLNDPGVWARNHDAHTVVVYTPRDLADFCLIWNLRAQHGWGHRLPLAVPLIEDAHACASAIVDLQRALTVPGFSPTVHLISESVSDDRLADVARHLLAAGGRADIVPPHWALQPAVPPSRIANSTLTLTAGRATVSTRSDADRNDLAAITDITSRRRRPPDLELTVRSIQEPIASLRSLRGAHWPIPCRHTGNGPTVAAGLDTLSETWWPSGWAQLVEACRDRGVVASPSAGGLTATALIHTLGRLHETRWLAHRPLLELLYRTASASGMSWWKARSAEQARIVSKATDDPQEALTALMQAIANVDLSHTDVAAHTITYSQVCAALGGSESGTAWLNWAESRKILLRGTTLRCPHCKYKDWRTIAGLSLPFVCLGCGEPTAAPFNHSSLNFAYRLAEPLRRCVDNDSIYHAIAARSLFITIKNSAVPIVGVHPGVDLHPIGSPEQKAEADVLILLADASMIPVEFKTNSDSFTTHDIDRLNQIQGWLGSRVTIAATAHSDNQISDAFRALAVDDPDETPRRLLTAEDWLEPFNVTTMDRPYPGAGSSPRHQTADDLDAAFPQLLRDERPDQEQTDLLLLSKPETDDR